MVSSSPSGPNIVAKLQKNMAAASPVAIAI